MVHKKHSSSSTKPFICFTSRPSTTSTTATTIPSLSRSLRRNSSLNGRHSPLLPPSLLPPEPSSPKVTCIGQVRIKSKNHNSSSTTCRNSSRRKTDCAIANICEALRGLGSDLNCFFPCTSAGTTNKSRTSSSGGERRGCAAVLARWMMVVEENEVGKVENLVSLVIDGDGENFKREELEVDVEVSKNDEEEEGRVSVCVPPPNALLLMRCRSDPVRMAALASRFWDSPKVDDRVVEVEEEEEDDDVNEMMVNEYVMARVVEAEREDDGIGDVELLETLSEEMGPNESGINELFEEEEGDDGALDGQAVAFDDSGVVRRMSFTDNRAGVVDVVQCDRLEKKPTAIRNDVNLLDKKLKDDSSDIYLLDRREVEEEIRIRRSQSCSESRRSFKWQSKLRESGRRRSLSSKDEDRRRHVFSLESRRSSFCSEREARRPSFCNEGCKRWSLYIEREDLRLEKALKQLEVKKAKEEAEKHSVEEKEEHEEAVDVQNLKVAECKTDIIVNEGHGEELVNVEIEDRATKLRTVTEKEDKKSSGLPDCLLLMMYEPKLSMEVSKETWVCSTDFLRPHRPRQPPAISKVRDEEEQDSELDKSNDETKMKDLEDHKDQCSKTEQIILPVEPAPEPVSLPSPQPVPNVSFTEKKSKGIAAGVLAPLPTYGPLVLTRCKSEPMRSSARLIADACFWKDRHRPLNAAGIGF